MRARAPRKQIFHLCEEVGRVGSRTHTTTSFYTRPAVGGSASRSGLAGKVGKAGWPASYSSFSSLTSCIETMLCRSIWAELSCPLSWSSCCCCCPLSVRIELNQVDLSWAKPQSSSKEIKNKLRSREEEEEDSSRFWRKKERKHYKCGTSQENKEEYRCSRGWFRFFFLLFSPPHPKLLRERERFKYMWAHIEVQILSQIVCKVPQRDLNHW